MSFNKKFLSKSPIAYHGETHGGDVTANTKAFSKMSDILPKKNITPAQQSTYGLGTSTNANWEKPKKPSDEQKAKSLEMQKKMLEIRDSKAGTKILNDVQDKLETAGMVPGVGIVPDAINTGISAARGLSAKVSGDKKGQLEAAKNMGIHGASMLPIGGIFAAGGNKLKKTTSRFMKEPTAYNNPVEKGFEIANNALTAMKQKGKSLDKKYSYFNYGDLTPDNAKFFGTKYGRSVAEVELPDGSTQLFYKSSGKAGKSGTGVGGTTEGLWQPYGGHANIPNVKDWFIKDKGYKDWYGSKSFRNISGNLDRLAVEGGWDLSKQSLASVKKVTKK